MSRLTRQAISLALAAMLAMLAVYGTYQPLHKSRLFREAYEKRATIRTSAQLVTLLSVPLEMPSPIGQAELIQGTATAVISFIKGEDTPPEVAMELVDFLNPFFAPIYQRGKGIGFSRNLYFMGTVNLLAYRRTQRAIYLTGAENLYLRGLQASPMRPQFLYGLLDVYVLAGDTEKVRMVADAILTQWPDDQRTRSGVAEYLAQPR
jgi:hypothetical protein